MDEKNRNYEIILEKLTNFNAQSLDLGKVMQDVGEHISSKEFEKICDTIVSKNNIEIISYNANLRAEHIIILNQKLEKCPNIIQVIFDDIQTNQELDPKLQVLMNRPSMFDNMRTIEDIKNMQEIVKQKHEATKNNPIKQTINIIKQKSNFNEQERKNILKSFIELGKANKAIRDFSLGLQNLDIEDAKTLGQMLASNSTITNLNLTNSKFKDNASEELVLGLKANKSLLELNIGSDQISKEFKQVLKTHKSVVLFNFEQSNSLDKKVVTLKNILECSKKPVSNNVLFMLIKKIGIQEVLNNFNHPHILDNIQYDKIFDDVARNDLIQTIGKILAKACDAVEEKNSALPSKVLQELEKTVNSGIASLNSNNNNTSTNIADLLEKFKNPHTAVQTSSVNEVLKKDLGIN